MSEMWVTIYSTYCEVCWIVTSVLDWSHVFSTHCGTICEAFSASKAHQRFLQVLDILTCMHRMLKCILWKKLQFYWRGCNPLMCCKGFWQNDATEDLAKKRDKLLEQQMLLPRNHQRPSEMLVTSGTDAPFVTSCWRKAGSQAQGMLLIRYCQFQTAVRQNRYWRTAYKLSCQSSSRAESIKPLHTAWCRA